MKVFVFGNPDYAPDALPLEILPRLKKRFPASDFIVIDPNEEWELPKKLVIIDTVQGIDTVTAFTNLEQFTRAPRLTVHDFDLGMKLEWLKKLNKLPPFIIIGIPPISRSNKQNNKKVSDRVVRILSEIHQ